MSFQGTAFGAVAGGLIVLGLGSAANKNPDELRIRKLVIVDDKGVDRIVVAAPVPDPLVLGKRIHRRSAASGIQINDTNGNERGGIVMLDDGSFIVGIDDDNCRERAHMFFIPKKGSGIYLQDGKERANISLSIPNGGKPEITATDADGKTTFSSSQTK